MNPVRNPQQPILSRSSRVETSSEVKRILIFSLTYKPFVGGAEIAIQEITNRISSSEIEFHLVTAGFDSALPRRERMGNVEVHRIGFGRRAVTTARMQSFSFYLLKILYIPLAAWKGARLHKKLRFDAVWAMMSYMVFPVRLMRLLGVRLPYAVTLQEGDPFEHVFRRARLLPFRFLLRKGFREAAVVQAISAFLGTWSRQMGFTGPLEIIPNGVDAANFSHEFPDSALESVRKKINTKPGDVFLVTTSRLVRKNAVDTVIRALALLPEHIKCVVIGSGPEEHSLKSLARTHDVAERIRFLGQVDYADIPLYLKACDIFIRPSRSEGMGNSFIEAMAAGLPVIATQEGGIADFLFDAKRNQDKLPTGFAVDKDAPVQIAETVTYILAHSDEVKRTVKNARELVAEKYDWNRMARDMKAKIFGRLLGV